MKRIIRTCLAPVLVFAMIISTCLIAPLTASAENYISADWTASSNEKAIVQDGDFDKGYNITTMGGFVRCNNSVNTLTGVKFRAELGTGWYAITFESDTANTPGLGSAAEGSWKKIYILKPQNDNELLVQYYDGGAKAHATVTSFDLSVEHTYGFKLSGSGTCYYFAIDGKSLLTDNSTTLEEMNTVNTNGGAYVSVGSQNVAKMFGFRVPNYNWTLSGTASTDGNIEDGYTLNTNAGAYARLNSQVDAVSGISLKWDPAASSSWRFISFEQTKENAPGLKNVGTKKMYLLRATVAEGETKGTLKITLYNGGEVVSQTIEGFDFSAEHTYGFKLSSSGTGYYFAIDGQTLITANSVPLANMEELNNSGAGAYITLGGNVATTFTDIKPVAWTSSNVTENENGGYDLALSDSSSVRYNIPVDMTKGIMFKVSSSAEWFSLSVEGTKKTSYGGLGSLISDKKIYIMNIKPDTQQYRTRIWDGSAGVGSQNVSVDTTGYIHINYRLNDTGTHWYLYVNGQRAISADSISKENFESLFNGGKVYLTIQTKNGDTTVTDFKKYSAPGLSTGTYSVADDIVYGIDAPTAVETLSKNITAKTGELRVYTADGSLVEEGKLVTGMKVCSYINTNDMASWTISINGDTDCDGDITANDISTMRKDLLGADELSGACEKAADMDNSGDIDIRDLVRAKKNLTA